MQLDHGWPSGERPELTALRQLDANLLVALDALLEAKSVTTAARRLGVTQSAMSHTLRRLRGQFGDELLVRTGRHMSLTPRAEELKGRLRGALLGLARAIGEDAGFDPGSSDRTFRLLSPDLFDVLVLPELMGSLARQAPGVSLTVRWNPERISSRLAAGELDFAVMPTLRGAAGPGPLDEASLESTRLLSDEFICFFRQDHPTFASRRMTRAAFLQAEHLLVSPGGEGPGLVDTVLAREGERRRVALRVPSFAGAVQILRHSDLVLVAPASLKSLAEELGLGHRGLPVEVPGHALWLTWHRRVDQDPGHRWFREQLLAAVKTSGAGSR